MTVEVHTENVIEGAPSEDDSPPPNRKVQRIVCVALTVVLIVVIAMFVFIGNVNASAPGGCGGG